MIVDDSEFTARNERNFVWVTFTRSNPAADIEGIGAFIDQKHWGCTGSLVIDARIKPHHAPPLVDDPAIERKVDLLAAPGRSAARGLLRNSRRTTGTMALHSIAPVVSLLITDNHQRGVGPGARHRLRSLRPVAAKGVLSMEQETVHAIGPSPLAAATDSQAHAGAEPG